MNDFYIYLSSQIKNIFNNSPSSFKTKLVKRIELTDEYEIGLAEISYTLAFKNVFQDEPIKLIWYSKERKFEEKIFYLKAGYYTIESLIGSIEEAVSIDISPRQKLPRLDIIKTKNIESVKLTLGRGVRGPIFMLLSENLCRMLGFSYKELQNHIKSYIDYVKGLDNDTRNNLGRTGVDLAYDIFSGKTIFNPQTTYDITGGFHTLFVYCDLIKPNLVGDSNTQLLKVVEIPNDISYGEQVHLTYPHIQYFPLQKFDIETVEIEIKDDSGLNVPFTHAKNLIVLHIRKRNNKKSE